MPDKPKTDSEEQASEFKDLGEEKPLSLLGEFRHFVLENKAWWMIPIIAVLSIVGLLVVLGATGAAPFIYTLF